MGSAPAADLKPQRYWAELALALPAVPPINSEERREEAMVQLAHLVRDVRLEALAWMQAKIKETS